MWEVIPPWVFFGISSSLVLVAIIDTAYVGWLFNQGRVDTLWPVRLLRVLVTALVTTFYPSMLEFVIFPLLCYISHHTRENLTWLIQKDATPVCEPFSLPQVLITVPALLLACVFVAFATVASYLSFEVNPLSRHPMAICNGRVETLWTAFKTAAILIVFRKNLGRKHDAAMVPLPCPIGTDSIARLTQTGCFSVASSHLFTNR